MALDYIVIHTADATVLSCRQVVAHVVRQGDTGLIQPLSLAAAHCMGEVTLSSETKESDHKYKNNSKAEVDNLTFLFLMLFMLMLLLLFYVFVNFSVCFYRNIGN